MISSKDQPHLDQRHVGLIKLTVNAFDFDFCDNKNIVFDRIPAAGSRYVGNKIPTFEL